MKRNSYSRIQHVTKFIEEVFGDNLPFEVESGDEIIRNVGRRTEDAMGVRTILEERCANIVFSISFFNDAAPDGKNNLPDVFDNPDFPKILRNRYREINHTGIQYWKIDYHYSRLIEDTGNHNQVTFRFTVGYDDENM